MNFNLIKGKVHSTNLSSLTLTDKSKVGMSNLLWL